MIYLTKGQSLFDNSSMTVYDQTGYYNDGDSVICATINNPDEPVCRYEAKFIAYGNVVYNITDPEKLMEEITKIDPKTLYGKESQQIATDKAVDQIVPQTSGDTSATPTEEISQITKETVVNDTTSLVTPPQNEPAPLEYSITTPSVSGQNSVENSTTTPETTLKSQEVIINP